MNRLAVAVLVIAGLFTAAEASAPAPAALANQIVAATAAMTSPAPSTSAPPSPTVVVPLVDISVSNGSAPPSASPSPSPSATPSPVERHGHTPRPTPTPTATPSVAPTAPDTSATSIPTQPPTPRPVAPFQPSIPDSLDDPNVQNILSRPGQLSSFNWMAGTWQARTFVNHGGGKQRDLGKNTYVFAATMKGRWMFGGDGHATDYFYITYDPFARQWALVRLAGNPSYGVWLSHAGWRGSRITFDSTYSWVNGRQYRRRVTINHAQRDAFSIFDEEQLPSGEWLADQSVELSKR